MSKGKSESDSQQSIYRQRPSDLAFRDDLEDSIGIIVGLPPHIIDKDGSVTWGNWELGGPYESAQVYIELETFIIQTINDALCDRGNLPPLDVEQPTHLYDYPPAAQGLPEIAAVLWEHGKPILENVLMAYEAGKLMRTLLSRVQGWYGRKNEEITRLNEKARTQGNTPLHQYVRSKVTLTQGSIISLLVAELVDREGYKENLELDIQARGYFGFSSPGHPNFQLTYLIRAAYDGLQFGYVSDSQGNVSEYFRIDDRELVSLPLPKLLPADPGEIEALRHDPVEEKVRLRMK